MLSNNWQKKVGLLEDWGWCRSRFRIFMGGGAKDYVRAHSLVLSEPYFVSIGHSDTKWNKKENTVNHILGAPVVPLWTRDCHVNPEGCVILCCYFIFYFCFSFSFSFFWTDRPLPQATGPQSTENPTGPTGNCSGCQIVNLILQSKICIYGWSVSNVYYMYMQIYKL